MKPTNCFVVMFVDSGSVLLSRWNVGKMVDRRLLTRRPPVKLCTPYHTIVTTIRNTMGSMDPHIPKVYRACVVYDMCQTPPTQPRERTMAVCMMRATMVQRTACHTLRPKERTEAVACQP